MTQTIQFLLQQKRSALPKLLGTMIISSTQRKAVLGQEQGNTMWLGSTPHPSPGLTRWAPKRFLSMIDCHFQKESVLDRNITRNTLKVSYSTMVKMGKIISGKQNGNWCMKQHRARQMDETAGNQHSHWMVSAKLPTLWTKITVSIADSSKENIGLTTPSKRDLRDTRSDSTIEPRPT